MGFLRRETLIERLCRESGWLVTDREGDYHRIRPDDGSPLRYLSVRCRDDQPFVKIWLVFPVRFPLTATETALMPALLKRNHNLFFGRWCLNVLEACEINLSLHHTAIKAGLTAGTFLTICREMLTEREELHDLLCDQAINLQPQAIPTSCPVEWLDPARTPLPPAQGQPIGRLPR